MLNLKKGLALVLAAATAFTFAPVANLGVTADAASAGVSHQHYTLQNSDFGLDATGKKASTDNRKQYNNTTTTEGTIAATTTDWTADGKGVGLYDFDGLWLFRNITLNDGRVYALSNVNSGIDANNVYLADESDNTLHKLKVNGTFYTNYNSEKADIETDSSNFPKTLNTNGKYHNYRLVIKVTSKNGGSLEFMDQNATQNTYQDVVYTVNSNGATGAQNTYKTAIFKYKGSKWVEADHENNASQDNQYNLQLNNSTNAYYAVGVYTSGATVSTWTGYTANVDSVYATSTSGNLTWTQPESGNLTTKLNTAGTPNGTITPAGGSEETYYIGTAGSPKTAGPNLFYVTTPNSAVSTITVTFNLKSGSKTDVDTQTLDYVVDRSDYAVDWIKWGSKKLEGFDAKDADGNSYWKAGSNDTWGYQVKQVMDPYIKNTADVVVKSESRNLTFLSSDSTIASVESNYQGKYYKAHITAKSAGTATLSIYVNGTTNNKGKIYTIPIEVSQNGKDAFDISDSENLYQSEVKDTIYLDAADQTASNTVNSTKLTIASKGGLKIKNLKSSNDSVVTVGSDGTLKATAKIADLASPKTATITWSSVSDFSKNVTGSDGSITVVVWAKPRAQFTVDPVVLDLGSAAKRTATLTTNPVLTNVVWSEDADNKNGDELGEDNDKIYTLTNSATGNTQTTATVVARAYGTAHVKALVTETATTRPTAVKTTVTVGAENKNVLTSDQTSLLLTEGDTATINVSASDATKAIAVSSDKTDVATAVSGAAVSGKVPVTVTAVKAGTANIVVKSDGADTLTIPVVVVSKNAIENATPEKVTGLKVSNKKGAYVSVKWTSQDKNINYRVYKKVGNGKWVGKNVAGSKTTLSVKKGAKVQVKVKSYVKDPNGKTTWGPAATKAKTFKTDKK